MNDLTRQEARVITRRIKKWVDEIPIGQIEMAYMGRIWLAMSYNSWSEWCEGELGGFKLPAPKRREVVAKLADVGMSNRAIADVVGVSLDTANRDVKAGERFRSPDRKVIGQDGKAYAPSKPKLTPKNLASQDNQPVESPQKEISEGVIDEAKDSEMSIIFAQLQTEDSREEKNEADVVNLSVKYNAIKTKLKEYLGVAINCEVKGIIAIHVKDLEEILTVIRECAESGTMDEELQKILTEGNDK